MENQLSWKETHIYGKCRLHLDFVCMNGDECATVHVYPISWNGCLKSNTPVFTGVLLHELLYRSNGCCVMRVIVSLKGVEWSGYRLTVANTRLLIDRRQNLFIEIARRLSCPPVHYIYRALPAWWQTLMTDPSWTIRTEQCSLAFSPLRGSTALIWKPSIL